MAVHSIRIACTPGPTAILGNSLRSACSYNSGVVPGAIQKVYPS